MISESAAVTIYLQDDPLCDAWAEICDSASPRRPTACARGTCLVGNLEVVVLGLARAPMHALGWHTGHGRVVGRMRRGAAVAAALLACGSGCVAEAHSVSLASLVDVSWEPQGDAIAFTVRQRAGPIDDAR